MLAAVIAHDAGDSGIDFLPAVAFFALAGGVVSGLSLRFDLILVDDRLHRFPGIHGCVPAGVSAGGMGLAVAAAAENGTAGADIQTFQVRSQIPVGQKAAAAQGAYRWRGTGTPPP